MFIRL